jgi:capsular exopolysaccharide synthesis family protein
MTANSEKEQMPQSTPVSALITELEPARKVGRYPRIKRAELGLTSEDAAIAEQYRIIRTKISQDPARSRVILVTSANPGDGKSTTAANLAFALALRRDTSVLLLQGDSAERARRSRRSGLPDVLSRSCTLDEALISVDEASNMYVLAASEQPVNISELIGPPDWNDLTAALRERFEHIIIDCPPIGALSNYYVFQSMADGIVVVVRPEHTGRAAFSDAMKSLPRQKLLGVVINSYKEWFFWRKQSVYGQHAESQLNRN